MAAEVPPSRVISLSLCADPWLVRWLPPSRVAGLSSLARDPALSPVATEAASYPSIPADAESILSAAPDLVILSRFGHTALAEILERHHIRTWYWPEPERLSDMPKALQSLAETLGDATFATPAIAQWHAALQAIPSGQTNPSVAIWGEGGPIEHPLLKELVEQSGGHVLPPQRQSLESLLASRPALLLQPIHYPGHPALGIERLEHPAFVGTRRLTIPGAAALCPGPEMLALLPMLREALR